MRNLRRTSNHMLSGLLIAVLFALSGASFAADNSTAAAKGSGDQQFIDSLSKIQTAQPALELPVPLKQFAPEEKKDDTTSNYSSSRNNTCTPNPAIAPGSGFSPRINDQVRNTAIIGLLDKIANCKPLPYSHDGIVNNNSEGGMPNAPSGFYREYTLMVPGRQTGDGPVPVNIGGQIYMTGEMLSARGPERIIIGGGKEIYYTMDHYKTFIHLTIVK